MLKVLINNKEYKYNGSLNIQLTELLDILGVEYSCSCLQGICGACAMIINGTPKLACKTILKEDIYIKNFHQLRIEPLSKFPLIKDLKVDRTILYETLKQCELYLKTDAKVNKNTEFEYSLSQCLMCGCCIEVCTNYEKGDFSGAILPVHASKINLQEKDKKHLEKINNEYEKHFQCTKSLLCEDICPVGIKTEKAIDLMNNKLKSKNTF